MERGRDGERGRERPRLRDDAATSGRAGVFRGHPLDRPDAASQPVDPGAAGTEPFRERGRAMGEQPRLWRWCVMVTLRQARQAVRRGRWVSRPNLERVATRRWWRLSAGFPAPERDRLMHEARQAIRRAWTKSTSLHQGDR